MVLSVRSSNALVTFICYESIPCCILMGTSYQSNKRKTVSFLLNCEIEYIIIFSCKSEVIFADIKHNLANRLRIICRCFTLNTLQNWCISKNQQICSIMVKELNWLNFPGGNYCKIDILSFVFSHEANKVWFCQCFLKIYLLKDVSGLFEGM